MIPLTAREIAESTGGEIVAGDAAVRVETVSTDSRAIAKGCVFVALHGEKFDGHQFLPQARERGAAVAIVDAASPAPAGMTVVRVPDTRRALGQLARSIRRKIHRTRVIAIAGSNGKTSTKNLLHAVLSRTLRGSASPKSFNNDIGVPATIFPVRDEDDYVILEIGTNHPGEVENLARIAEPDIAVITSIGEEHLEFFGDLDGVRRENAAVATGLRPGGLLIINGDDPHLGDHLKNHAGPIIRFGFNADNDLVARDVRVTIDGASFTVDGRSYFVPTPARHFASNCLAVIAIARHFGLDYDTIRTGLAFSDASEMRMQKRVYGPVTVINDAYNANPTSMRASLETLAQIEWDGRKIVVMGDMRELGEHTGRAHADTRDLAQKLAFSQVFAVGSAFSRACENTSGIECYPDSATAAAEIAGRIEPGDLVLLKGSRGTKLEVVGDAIAAKFS